MRKTKYIAEQFLLPLEVSGTRAAHMRCDCGTKEQADHEIERIKQREGSNLIEIQKHSKKGFYWVTYKYKKEISAPLWTENADFKHAMKLSDAMRAKL